MEVIDSILWQGFVLPGHESCRLFSRASRWHLDGTAVFSHEKLPCRLDYQIICDDTWRTLETQVKGWLGTASVDLQITTDPAQHWWVNGVMQPNVEGCLDIDLNFSPSTNLLPIKQTRKGSVETCPAREEQ